MSHRMQHDIDVLLSLSLFPLILNNNNNESKKEKEREIFNSALVHLFIVNLETKI